jgi:hypothetical protein
VALTTVSWDPKDQAGHTAPPQQGASPVHRHDSVLLGERHRIAPVGPFIELGALSEGP